MNNSFEDLERYLLFGPPKDERPTPPKGDGAKPKDKEQVIYRIIDRKTGKAQGVYSRAYHDEYDFQSAESARTANCHNIHSDIRDFKIAKYKVTYKLIEDDVDNK